MNWFARVAQSWRQALAEEIVTYERQQREKSADFLGMLSSPDQRRTGLYTTDRNDSEALKVGEKAYSWAYVCVDRIASAFAARRLRFYKEAPTADKEPQELTDPRLSLPGLFASVNPEITARTMKYLMAADLLLVGNSYWWLKRSQSRLAPITEMWRLQPDRVKVCPGAENWVDSYIFETGGKKVSYPREEILHIILPDPANDFLGRGKLAAAALAVESDKAAAEANLRIGQKGFRPDALVEMAGLENKTQEELDELTAAINRRYGGKSAHLQLVASGVKWTPWQSTLRDMEMPALRTMSRTEIAAVFNVPPPIAGIYDQSTFNNMQEARSEFYGGAVMDMARIVCGGITEHLILPNWGKGLYCEADFSDVDALQDAKLDEKQADWTLVQGGGMTINEWRHKWEPDLPDLPWGDEGYMPGSQLPVGMIGQFLAAPEPPPPGPAKTIYILPAHAAPKALPEAGGGAGPFVTGSRGDRIWQKFDRAIRPFEKRVQRLVAGLIRDEAEATLAKLRALKAAGGLRKKAPGSVDQLLFDLREEVDRWNVVLTPEQEAILTAFGQRALTDLGEDAAKWDIHDPRAVEYLHNREQRIVTIVGNREAELRATLAEGYSSGETITDLMARVEQFGTDADWKAARIARTEVVGASNAGAYVSYDSLGMGREWIATRDDRTRDAHVAMDGQKVGPGQKFRDPLDGATGFSPGNMSTAASSINCRCTCGAFKLQTGEPAG